MSTIKPVRLAAQVVICVLITVASCLASDVEHLAVQPEVRFYLLPQYENGALVELRTGDTDLLRNSSFDPAHSTRLIVHGWGGDTNWTLNTMVGKAYLDHPATFNLITVDWTDYASVINYLQARRHVRPVGAMVAEFIEFLRESGGLQLNNTGMVGLSLGAHVSGMVGKQLRNGQLGFIVGLDPAGPLFPLGNADERLAITDASYVEIISTNRGVLGINGPIGHADFYPNWGVQQPGCGRDWFGSCSHARSVHLFAESIRGTFGKREFVATECGGFVDIQMQRCVSTGIAVMGGEPLNGHTKGGVYFVRTNANSPFAI